MVALGQSCEKYAISRIRIHIPFFSSGYAIVFFLIKKSQFCKKEMYNATGTRTIISRATIKTEPKKNKRI